jgi:hypothetical protein
MSVSSRLTFDPSNTGASHTVGSYLLAGTDGDQISSGDGSADNIATSFEGIDTRGFLYGFDGSTWDRLTATSGALDINIASGSVAIGSNKDEDTAHITGDTGDYVLTVREDSLSSSTSADGDYQSFKTNSTGALYIDGSQFDINVNLQAGDGTDITETGGALDVNIASGDVDDSLADTAVVQNTKAVSTSAIDVVTSALTSRKWLYLANEGSKTLYFGTTGVTVANGFPLHKGMQAEFRIGASPAFQVIGASGSSSEDLRTMELS